MNGLEVLKRIEKHLFLEMCCQSYKSFEYLYYENAMNFIIQFIEDEEDLQRHETTI